MTESRHEHIDAGRRRAGLSVQQLWLDYLSFSGLADLIEVEAYLHGLLTLTPYQEDKLAHAVNERLHDLYQTARIPYSGQVTAPLEAQRPIDDIVEELLDGAKRQRDDG
jgi:hypothetical protein